jgi:hypothetical protein
MTRTKLLLMAMLACKAASVTDAEAKGDVKYLVAQGTPEAIAALGRLADKNPAAKKALDDRAGTDMNVYTAAWQATLRDAEWGPQMLRDGLADVSRAELAAIAMTRKDPHLDAFASDLDGAMRLVGNDSRAVSVPAVFASAGKAAQPFIEKRLADSATREGMCRGLASPDASADSRATFMRAPPSSRDGQSCLHAAAQLAKTDDAALTWVGATAEPGLLTALGKDDAVGCDRLATAWSHAISDRPAAECAQLTVPLAAALERCSAALDPALAAALDKGDFATVIVGAIDPVDPRMSALKATCARLPPVSRSPKIDARLRGRAADALAKTCSWN